MENTADALVLLNCTTRRVSIPEKLKNMIGRCDNDTLGDNDMYQSTKHLSLVRHAIKNDI